VAACWSTLSKNQVGAAREKPGRNACSTFLIIDAQSVKNTGTASLTGYAAGKKVSGVKDILGEHVNVQVAKRSELHTFKVMPKRWIVERRFAWLGKNRRLWKNCERWLNASLQFVNLAFLALLLRRR
jgi:hypothetical protein